MKWTGFELSSSNSSILLPNVTTMMLSFGCSQHAAQIPNVELVATLEEVASSSSQPPLTSSDLPFHNRILPSSCA